MNFEEYKIAVDKKCKDTPIAKQYPQEYKRAFDAEIEELFTDGESVDSAAWFIDLMIGTD